MISTVLCLKASEGLDVGPVFHVSGNTLSLTVGLLDKNAVCKFIGWKDANQSLWCKAGMGPRGSVPVRRMLCIHKVFQAAHASIVVELLVVCTRTGAKRLLSQCLGWKNHVSRVLTMGWHVVSIILALAGRGQLGRATPEKAKNDAFQGGLWWKLVVSLVLLSVPCFVLTVTANILEPID